MSNKETLVEGFHRPKKSASAPAFTSSPAVISTHPLYDPLAGVEVPITPLPLRESATLADASTLRFTPAEAMPAKASIPSCTYKARLRISMQMTT